MKSRVVAALAAVLSFLVFAVAPALAQTAPPSPPPKLTVPPAVINAVTNVVTRLAGEAAAPYNVDPNHNRGTVTYFRRFDLQIRMPLNTYRNIRLHQGTVIDPRGASIAPGQVVDVIGHTESDGTLDADTITIVH